MGRGGGGAGYGQIPGGSELKVYGLRAGLHKP